MLEQVNWGSYKNFWIIFTDLQLRKDFIAGDLFFIKLWLRIPGRRILLAMNSTKRPCLPCEFIKTVLHGTREFYQQNTSSKLSDCLDSLSCDCWRFCEKCIEGKFLKNLSGIMGISILYWSQRWRRYKKLKEDRGLFVSFVAPLFVSCGVRYSIRRNVGGADAINLQETSCQQSHITRLSGTWF